LPETRTRVAQTEVEVRFLPETFAVVFPLFPTAIFRKSQEQSVASMALKPFFFFPHGSRVYRMAVTKARRIERRNRRVDEEARGSERSVSQDPDKTKPNLKFLGHSIEQPLMCCVDRLLGSDGDDLAGAPAINSRTRLRVSKSTRRASKHLCGISTRSALGWKIQGRRKWWTSFLVREPRRFRLPLSQEPKG
jgi:hypothetical protein